MARRGPTFVCQNCGALRGRWQGKCDACGEWNTIVEESAAADARLAGPGKPPRKGRPFALEPLAGETLDAPRLPSGIAELDRVTGGGFVRGSVLLVGGDPGIGKSTLLIQAAAALARAGHRAVYISGEEAVTQVRLRAERLGLASAPVRLAAETSVEDIVATLSQGKTPRLVVIDSIQTMWTDTVESAPGTVTQVRASAQTLIRFAKRSGAAVILVGHVTKDGQIAGPRVVEHMVDAVLSFEGEEHAPLPHPARGEEPLRADRRDRRIRDDRRRPAPRSPIRPGACFFSERDPRQPRHRGLCRRRGLTPAARRDPGAGRADDPRHAAPRRHRLGPEPSLRWCSAVLEAHCGVKLSGHDVYLNVAGAACRASRSLPPILPPPPPSFPRLGNSAAARRRVLRRGVALRRHPSGGAERRAPEGRRRSLRLRPRLPPRGPPAARPAPAADAHAHQHRQGSPISSPTSCAARQWRGGARAELGAVSDHNDAPAPARRAHG